MADVEQMKKIVQFVTCEIAFVKNVCELMFGIDVHHLNLGVHINPVKQPIQSNPLGSSHVSHCWTPAFDYHLNHGFMVLKDIQHDTKLRWSHVRRNVINIIQIQIDVLGWILVVHVECGVPRQVSL